MLPVRTGCRNFRLRWRLTPGLNRLLILRHDQRIAYGSRRLLRSLTRPGSTYPTLVESFSLPARPMMNLQLPPDLASSDKPPMSIPLPLSIAPPEAFPYTLQLTLAPVLSSAASLERLTLVSRSTFWRGSKLTSDLRRL